MLIKSQNSSLIWSCSLDSATLAVPKDLWYAAWYNCLQAVAWLTEIYWSGIDQSLNLGKKMLVLLLLLPGKAINHINIYKSGSHYFVVSCSLYCFPAVWLLFCSRSEQRWAKMSWILPAIRCDRTTLGLRGKVCSHLSHVAWILLHMLQRSPALLAAVVSTLIYWRL